VVALVFSVVGLLVGIGIVIWQMRRRPLDAPLTWGEAMVAATFVFFLMMLAYGVIPHQWLNWADSELKWRADRILEGPNGIIASLPIEMTYEALRDMVAAGIYVVMLGLQIALFAVWQNRGKAKPIALPTSPYGRPLVKKS
jgi:Na+-driven multidrug efflux pump